MIIGLLGSLINNENLGCVALTYSQIKLLDEIGQENNIKIQYYIFEANSNEQKIKLAEQNLNISHGSIKSYDIRPLFKLRRFLHHFFVGMNTLIAFRKCDLFIDLTAGDSFTDIYGQYTFDSETNVKLLVKKIKKPLILGPQTYGPFQHKKNIKKAIKAIEASDLVISRDQKSLEYLSTYTDKNIIVTTDLAFALPYNKKKTVTTNKINVGINISGLLIHEKTENTTLELKIKTDYELYIQSIIDWLIEAKIYKVFIIPHVGNDGNEWAKRKYGNQLNYFNAFEDPITAKNEISTMNIFIGSRMHATIGAFSAGIATIPVAYSRKFSGLFNHLEYKYIIDLIEDDTEKAILDTITYIQNYKQLQKNVKISKKLIHKELKNNMNEYRNLILSICKDTPRKGS